MRYKYIFLFCALSFTLLGQQHLAIRSNSTLTTSWNNNDTTWLKWPTSEKLLGTAIRYDAATGGFVCDSAGRYVVIATEKIGTDGVSALYELAPILGIFQSGKNWIYGETQDYMSLISGSDESQLSASALLDVAAGDTIRIVGDRGDNNTFPGSEPKRAGEESSVVIFKVPDHWNYSRYYKRSPQTISGGSNGISNVTWDSIGVQQSPFSLGFLGNDDIDRSGNNYALVFYTIQTNNASASTYMNIQTRNRFANNTNTLRIFGDDNYISNSDGITGGHLEGSGVWSGNTSNAGFDFSIQTVNRRAVSGSLQVISGEIQFLEIPSSSLPLAWVREDNENNANADDLVKTHDIFEEVGTSHFTWSANDDHVNVDLAGNYLIFYHVGIGGSGGADHSAPRARLSVNGSDVALFGESDYIHGSSTTDHMGLTFSGLLTDLQANDEIQFEGDRLNNFVTNSFNANTDVLNIINLSALLGVGSPPSGNQGLKVFGSRAAKVQGSNYSKVKGVAK